MRNPTILWIIMFIMLLLDIYVFQAVKTVLPAGPTKLRMTVMVIYWLLAVAALGTLLLFPYLDFDSWPKQFRIYLISMLVAAFFSKLVASLFFAVDDIRRGGMWIITRLFSNPSVEISQASDGITRSVFLSWLGLAMGGGLLSTLVYGFSNKYNYRTNRIPVAFKNLPVSFDGLKIVQISDIHAGSLMDKAAVQKGVNKIISEKPDLILFTGDLVNDYAREMDNYVDIFSSLTAPLGIYSVLGNHDYGDYVQWESQAAKRRNLEQLKKVHERLGWRLLMNEHVVLEKNDERIALIGVENWGAKGNFPKYGKLGQAYSGTAGIPFKILLSHDPSHWDGEVRKYYHDIDFTLSGHTHGMQFGVEVPGFKWSPVQYMYKQWAGLYEQDGQKLYINRGFGFLGYPGRVGILPEITVFTLTHSM